jgi:cytochrome oxidase Cu insertion factor (SCO1/SenC/PrrC family)
MTLPANLEPALRDPRKLRRTAWILVGIMIAGGSLVYTAYEKWAASKAGDTRPAMIHKVRKEHQLRVLRQDGARADLFEPSGRVWAVHTLALSPHDSSAISLDVMKRLAGIFSGNDDFTLVSLVVDPPAAGLDAALANMAKASGMELPGWWLAASDPADTHKFIKAQLKAGIFPHQENGRWVHDTSIVLIDRAGRVRRAVVPSRSGGAPYIAAFDFDQAAKWDSEDRLTGTGRSNVEELEMLLVKTIKTLLDEPQTPR